MVFLRLVKQGQIVNKTYQFPLITFGKAIGRQELFTSGTDLNLIRGAIFCSDT